MTDADHTTELNMDGSMDECFRALMLTLGMTEEAQITHRLSVADVKTMCQRANEHLQLAAAIRIPEHNEGFTKQDAEDAKYYPARPLLERMVSTYTERRGTYGASEQKFADIMLALFPMGLTLTTRTDWVRYGLFHQMISKLSRYTKSWNDPHVDSVHDIGPYAAMLEAEDRRWFDMSPFKMTPP
jgi:hypothetical protein